MRGHSDCYREVRVTEANATSHCAQTPDHKLSLHVCNIPCLQAASHSSMSCSDLATKYITSVLSPICRRVR